MSQTTIRFPKDKNKDFITTLRKRVKEYFKQNNLSPYANKNMVFKSIFMFIFYLTPYILMISGLVTNPWLIYLLWIWMGIAMSGIGLAVMHDANHGAYSKNKWVNRFLGLSLNFIGGNATVWKIQHNVLHHTYTNIDGMDEDITTISALRFTPHKKRNRIHRFQHIYAWFFYGIMTLYWISTKEFSQLIRYRKMGLTKREGGFFKLMIELSFWKLFYYGYALILPLVLVPVAWWWILIGFLSMHFVCGVILGSVFQSAHVMPDVEFPLANKEGNMENHWAVHQLMTTTNFAPKSRFFSWFIGGLNYQIEHHLFPNICHVHYKNISAIVKETAEEFALSYYCKKNFLVAVRNHIQMLRYLGKHDPVPGEIR
jgi:linoleoyl-CoA desaturase